VCGDCATCTTTQYLVSSCDPGSSIAVGSPGASETCPTGASSGNSGGVCDTSYCTCDDPNAEINYNSNSCVSIDTGPHTHK
jgi:hypothetical protein